VGQFDFVVFRLLTAIVIPSKLPLRSEGPGRADSCRRTKGAHPYRKLTHCPTAALLDLHSSVMRYEQAKQHFTGVPSMRLFNSRSMVTL